MEIFATRLNFYPDASSWKPFHHDSHAYGGHAVREDFTMGNVKQKVTFFFSYQYQTGASFGATRELVFLHPPTQQQFSFPQENGDVCCFVCISPVPFIL